MWLHSPLAAGRGRAFFAQDWGCVGRRGWLALVTMSITVRLHSGETHEGTLFCVDPVTKALVLEMAEGVYTMINPSQIAKIDEELTVPTPNIAAMGLNLSSLHKKEENALIMAEKNLDSINKNVTPIVQHLFDKLAHIFSNCRWEGNTMIILDNIVIDAPYDRAILATGNDNSQIDFVKKVLTGERKKLSM